jgi:hypothetical protein
MFQLPTAGSRLPRPLRVKRAMALAFCLVSIWKTDAVAYQWMIRHGYSGCANCHVDPSGSGVLEPYGALIANELLKMQSSPAGGTGEEGLVGAFAGGKVKLPEPLRLKGDVRGLALTRKIEGVPIESDFIWMQADFAAALRLDSFVASGSFGYADEGATLAAVSRQSKYNIVSRQHWLGFWTPDYSTLVRAGRMNLPFGVRTNEHTLWVRDATSTSINDHQAHGVSAYVGGEIVRGELMAVAGNYQVRPDDFRERGYSGYLELMPIAGLAVGISSLITHRQLDEYAVEKTWRHAHGGFVRWATPFEPVVVISEVDYVLTSPQNRPHQSGMAALVQADYELVQGIHLMATGEMNNIGFRDQPASFAGWLSYAWFFAPHADIRFDSIYYAFRSQSRTTNALAALMQFHVYL